MDYIDRMKRNYAQKGKHMSESKAETERREALQSHQVSTDPVNTVRCMLKTQSAGYNIGEIAWFAPDVAAKMVADGVAVLCPAGAEDESAEDRLNREEQERNGFMAEAEPQGMRREGLRSRDVDPSDLSSDHREGRAGKPGQPTPSSAAAENLVKGQPHRGEPAHKTAAAKAADAKRKPHGR